MAEASSPSAILEKSRLLEKAGDLLLAYDLLVDGLAQHPDDVELKHRAVLILARAGAPEHARREFRRLGLEDVTGNEDILALGGRLLKDLALRATGENRRSLARDSAAKYAQAYAVRHGTYPGINAASMSLLAGDAARVVESAEDVLHKIGSAPPPTSGEAYYVKATMAEALLLAGRWHEAEKALAEAVACDPSDYPAHASTLRQFAMITRLLGRDSAWLDRYRPPPALFYCGHMFSDLAPDIAPLVQTLRTDVDNALNRIKPGAVFGALAAGWDIMVAEAALARGAELHVVLPMRQADFLAQSVLPYGEAWRGRFEACLARAASFRFATHEPFLGDPSVFAYGTLIAMGLAVRHADHLQTRAEQLALWDGTPAAGEAGTAADVARWKTTGLPQTIVTFPIALRPTAVKADTAAPASHAAPVMRAVKAMLFGDVRGFSKLEETQIRPFVEQVLTPLAATLRGLPVQPEEVETWGDGLYIVYNDVAGAAAGALALLRRFAEIDLPGLGLPSHLALRLGGHAGPVTPLTDPFMGTRNFFGTHVTIAARIEPVAMPGSLYVSEPFAALLGLSAPGRYRTDYVGQTDLAKQFGAMRLFTVREI